MEQSGVVGVIQQVTIELHVRTENNMLEKTRMVMKLREMRARARRAEDVLTVRKLATIDASVLKSISTALSYKTASRRAEKRL